MGYKMIEYRERAEEEAPEELPPPSLQPGNTVPNLPSYSLAAEYGLGDDDMDIGNPGPNEQTVEQEYQAYIIAPLSPKTTNIIKFWEASKQSSIVLLILKGISDNFYNVPHTICHGDGLSSDPSIGCVV